VSATASTLIDRCSTSTKRAVQSRSVLIAGLCASHALPTSVAIAAARRHTLRELVGMIMTPRTTAVAVTAAVALVL
jgi:hypothetical protein